MLSLGPLGLLHPWLLLAAIALPLLWRLLRAVPPAPRRQVFPGLALLRGLPDVAPRMARMPWWLLALRMVALAALILGLAGPVWRPEPGGGPVPADADAVLVVMDAGWAAAPDWPARQQRAAAAITAAGTRPVALLLADGMQAGPLVFGPAAEALARLRAARPRAWPSTLPEAPESAVALAPAGRLASLWLSDGFEQPHRRAWAQALAARGTLAVVGPQAPVLALSLEAADRAAPRLVVRRFGAGAGAPVPAILAIGPDPQGVERVLARLQPQPVPGARGVHEAALDLPPELRNRIRRLALEGVASAGAVVLADARTQRPKLALSGAREAGEGQDLLEPAHYLRRAAEGFADLVEGSPAEVLQSAPDVVLLVDTVLPADAGPLGGWVRAGGTLIRFAGPRMAADAGLGEDPLLPLRLRPGGRETGGALSWGAPRDLAPWPEGSPLADLPRPLVAVRAQLVAEPGPEVAARSLARLEDATPLITRRALGAGQMILFHVAADPGWSDLPLSGLFVQILQRLAETAQPATPLHEAATESGAEGATLDGAAGDTLWRAQQVLDGWGAAGPAPAVLEPVRGADLDAGPAPGRPAGLYEAGGRLRGLDAGAGPLAVATDWPGARLLDAGAPLSRALTGWLLGLAALALLADLLASSRLVGRLRSRRAALP